MLSAWKADQTSPGVLKALCCVRTFLWMPAFTLTSVLLVCQQIIQVRSWYGWSREAISIGPCSDNTQHSRDTERKVIHPSWVNIRLQLARKQALREKGPTHRKTEGKKEISEDKRNIHFKSIQPNPRIWSTKPDLSKGIHSWGGWELGTYDDNRNHFSVCRNTGRLEIWKATEDKEARTDHYSQCSSCHEDAGASQEMPFRI